MIYLLAVNVILCAISLGISIGNHEKTSHTLANFSALLGWSLAFLLMWK